jgi:3-oxoacyl-[acyl-carrier protein] reductase
MRKSALVTGGSRGIGRSIAIDLAKVGYDVAITYNQSESDASQVVDSLRKIGSNAIKIKADFSEPQGIDHVFKQFDFHFSSLQVLVNNAGWTEYIPHNQLNDLTETIFDRIIDIHLKSVFFGSREAVKRMSGSNNNIINISSIAGYNGVGSNIAYCAAKAGVISMTKSLAAALGPDIRVNAVAPGLTETEMTLAAPPSYQVEQTKITPMARLATPQDISNAVMALIQNMTFVNGKTIIADGGRLS